VGVDVYVLWLLGCCLCFEGERRLLMSWAKAGKDSKGRNKATRSEGDDLGDSAARVCRRERFFFERETFMGLLLSL